MVTSKLTHELAQQLSFLALTLAKARVLAAKVTDPALGAQLGEVARSGEVHVDHVTDLLRRAQEIAEGHAAKSGVADAARVVETAMAMIRPELGRRARCEAIIEGRPQVGLPATELAQVLMNLLANAWRALPEGEAHKHRVSIHLRTEDDLAIFTVTDSGAGIPAEILPRIWDEGFTTKPEPKGAGLGLHIVRGIVVRRGGKITAESEPGKTVFIVKLPAVRD